MPPIRFHIRLFAILALFSIGNLSATPFAAISNFNHPHFTQILPRTGLNLEVGFGSSNWGLADHTLLEYPPEQSEVSEDFDAQGQFPSLSQFIDNVIDGDHEAIRGVYVPDVLALPVVQQPDGQAGFVSESPGTVTQFQIAAYYKVIGLLAHNYLSGELFDDLSIGQNVYIVIGDGAVDQYTITGVYRFQLINPPGEFSQYIDLDTGERLTTREVFHRFYQVDHRVTFQTCLEKDGNLFWGLHFVVAEPAKNPDFY